MGTALFIIALGNMLIFGGLGVMAAVSASRESSPRLRLLSWGFAAVCSAFVLGATTRLTLLAVRRGWLHGSVGDFLESGWVLMQSVAVMGLGISALIVVRNVVGPLRRAEQIVAAMSSRVPKATAMSTLGLTTRELEVLEVIFSGTESDRAIADALFISPSTAGTHVKNILRKAGLNSRRDLFLLAETG